MVSRLAPGGWSLRVRLVVGVVGLAAIALAVTGTIGATLLRSYLVQQLDQQLIAGEGALNGPLIGHGRVPGGTRPSDQLPNPFLFTELTSTGKVEQEFGGPSSTATRRPDLSSVTTAKVRTEAGRAFTVPAINGGSGFRVRAVERPDGSGAGTVAVSLETVDAAVHRLEVITLLVALGVLIVLIVLGSVAVRLALRPLDEVERTAEDISDGDLSRRVPVGRPGTEIGRLASTLNGMLAKVEVAFTARQRSETTLRQFIADASHELRTPLTTIRGYAELYRKGALPDDAARSHALGRIESEATRLGGLVDDLLLLAHLDQQRPLHVTTVDIAVLAAEGVADARVQDPARVITYSGPEQPVLVTVDGDRFRQVVTNLLGNALAHTPAGTAVHVTLTQDDADARLAVADEGPGLPPEQLRRIFERFYRADTSRARDSGGSGLGLAIVEAVVRACHGTVAATSQPGVGTEFVVTVPRLGRTHS
ncbi:HAMP domain-containing sensor histidine kinase [Jatrophihabitans sp.]|uniref:sensor histidine kinase n=1 Tax=Jatrophihabitans sp. TaxID=1932789 RepID=UPI0030C671DE